MVVVAAGAIQTPLLFQKNALANSSGQVGRRLRLPVVTATNDRVYRAKADRDA